MYIINEYLDYILNEENTKESLRQKIKDKYDEERDKLEKYKNIILLKLRTVGERTSKQFSSSNIIDDEIKKLKNIYSAKRSLINKREVMELSKLNKSKSGMIVVGSVLSSLIIFTAYNNYKNSREKILMRCKKLKGINKIDCYKDHEKDLLQKRISFLERSIFKCKKSSNELSCKKKINKEILKLKDRVKDLFSSVEDKVINRY